MSKVTTSALTQRFSRRSGIYLVDFAVFKPPDEWLASRRAMVESGCKSKVWTPESLDIMKKIAYGEALGMGETTAVPLLKGRSHFLNFTSDSLVDQSVEACVEECEAVMFPTAEMAMRNAGIRPSEVDYVLTTNSTFNPVPSLSARVCNHFKMRSDCINYSVSGHGCPAGILMIDMAKHILKANANKVVLLIAQDSLLPYFYQGNKQEFLFSNMLFRSGGAAILLSNRKRDCKRAKYEMLVSVRVLKADDDDFHKCIKMEEDENGKPGVLMQTKLVKKAAEAATRTAMTRLGPRVLPMSELVKAARDKQYKPDFTKGIHHLALHTAAKFAVQGVADSLRFPPEACQPCLESLYRFGNTSCSSTYYALANIESRRGIKRGERVLQMGMGSGFKCCMTVWEARRHVYTRHPAWDDNPLYDIAASLLDDYASSDPKESATRLLALYSGDKILPGERASRGDPADEAPFLDAKGRAHQERDHTAGTSLAVSLPGSTSPPEVAVQPPTNEGPATKERTPSPYAGRPTDPRQEEVLLSAPPGTPDITPILLSRSSRDYKNASLVRAVHRSSGASLQGVLNKPAAPGLDGDLGNTSHSSCSAPTTGSGAKAQLPRKGLTVEVGLCAPLRGAPSAGEQGFRHQEVLIQRSFQKASHFAVLPASGLQQDSAYPALAHASSTSLQQDICHPASGSQSGSPTISTMAAAATTTTAGTSMMKSSSSFPCTTHQPASPGSEQPVASLPGFHEREAVSAASPPLATSPPETSDSPEARQPTLGLSPNDCSKSPTRANGDLIRQATASLYARIQSSESTVDGSKQVVIPSSAKEKFKNAKARFDGVASVFEGQSSDNLNPRKV